MLPLSTICDHYDDPVLLLYLSDTRDISWHWFSFYVYNLLMSTNHFTKNNSHWGKHLLPFIICTEIHQIATWSSIWIIQSLKTWRWFISVSIAIWTSFISNCCHYFGLVPMYFLIFKCYHMYINHYPGEALLPHLYITEIFPWLKTSMFKKEKKGHVWYLHFQFFSLQIVFYVHLFYVPEKLTGIMTDRVY